MASTKIILYKHKVYSNGEHPISLQLIHNRKRKLFSTGFTASPKEWIEDIQRFSSAAKNYKNRNSAIEHLETKVEKIMTAIRRADKGFTFELFESMYSTNKNTLAVPEFYDLIISELESKEKINTADVYKTSKNVITAFFNGKSFSFYEVDYNFLKRYETYLFAKGNTAGGVHFHMRTLRSVINEAIRRKHFEAEHYPFSTQFNKNGYSIAHLKSTARPRALSISDMQLIKDFPIHEHPHLHQAHDMFLFSYYLRGINFVDMAQLKWKDNVYDGRITYTRSKTDKNYNIKITEAVEVILSRYRNGSEYVFPILNDFHVTEKQKVFRVSKCLKQFNKEIKEIADILKLDVNLTSYVARHTYASTLKKKGVNLETIREGLGHSEVATTQAYLESFSNDILDEADKEL